MTHEKQKEIFNELVNERALEFFNIKDKINPNNLVYAFKFDKNEPKDFKNYKAPLKLFEDVRNGNINPREALTNQARFKSHLNEIKTGGKKSEDQKNTIKNISKFFDLPEKIINF